MADHFETPCMFLYTHWRQLRTLTIHPDESEPDRGLRLSPGKDSPRLYAHKDVGSFGDVTQFRRLVAGKSTWRAVNFHFARWVNQGSRSYVFPILLEDQHGTVLLSKSIVYPKRRDFVY